MTEPRWRDVDPKTSICSHCGGTHHGTGMECPYREENMGQPCSGCGERTNYCCSDCAIDGAGKVYVCITDACRTAHEQNHRPAVRFDQFTGEAIGPPGTDEAWGEKVDEIEDAAPIIGAGKLAQ